MTRYLAWFTVQSQAISMGVYVLAILLAVSHRSQVRRVGLHCQHQASHNGNSTIHCRMVWSGGDMIRYIDFTHCADLHI